MSPRPGGDVSNSSEFAVMGSGEYAPPPKPTPPQLRALGKSLLARMAREHPTLLLTLGYLGLTFVGMIHDLWFYFYFRINILDFSETSDFLLAAIRNPLVIILSMLPVLMLLGFQRMRDTASRKSAWYESHRKKYANTRWNSVGLRTFVYGLFVMVYAIVFTQLYADRAANRIKDGKGRRVAVLRTDGISSDEQPILLGATGKFVFLYFPDRKATEIVPVESTVALTVDSRRRRDRERDSLAAMGQDSITP